MKMLEGTVGTIEVWGLGIAAALAFCRYVLDLDWDMRLTLRQRRRGKPGA